MEIVPNLHPDMGWFIIEFGTAFVGNPVIKNPLLDHIILKLCNINSANLFTPKQELKWSIYLTKPEIVNYDEYVEHVELMKRALDFDKNDPRRPVNTPTMTDYGEIYKPTSILIQNYLNKYIKF